MVTTFFPENPTLQNAINSLMKMDPNDYASVQRASDTIRASLAAEVGGGKASQALLQVLENAGPAVWLTNEGLQMVIEAMKLDSQFALDRENYVLELLANGDGNTRVTQSQIQAWNRDNFSNYNFTRERRQEIRDFNAKRGRIAELYNNSSPMPLQTNTEGVSRPDSDALNRIFNNNKKAILRHGGEFWRLETDAEFKKRVKDLPFDKQLAVKPKLVKEKI
jgi:hypothetical protein